MTVRLDLESYEVYEVIVLQLRTVLGQLEIY